MNNKITTEIDLFGTKVWFLNGIQHREGGPAIEHVDGNKYWKLKGKLHRENGPAIEYKSGYKAWFIEGRLHRVDGPAIKHRSGSKSWYLAGNYYPNEESWFQRLTPEQQCNYLWNLDE
jgi:hypothetical protein